MASVGAAKSVVDGFGNGLRQRGRERGGRDVHKEMFNTYQLHCFA